MERLMSMLGFLAKLAPALLPVGIYVLASDDPNVTLVVAFLGVGAFVAWHLLRAHMSGDDDVWDPVSIRSIELPLPPEDAVAAAADALSQRADSRVVHRGAFTITATVGRSNLAGVGGFLVTVSVRDAPGGGSAALLEVVPAGGDYARGPLDFGGGHKFAVSIERAIGDLADKRARERGQVASRAGTEPAARG
jgi:hypothetical protein